MSLMFSFADHLWYFSIHFVFGLTMHPSALILQEHFEGTSSKTVQRSLGVKANRDLGGSKVKFTVRAAQQCIHLKFRNETVR